MSYRSLLSVAACKFSSSLCMMPCDHATVSRSREEWGEPIIDSIDYSRTISVRAFCWPMFRRCIVRSETYSAFRSTRGLVSSHGHLRNSPLIAESYLTQQSLMLIVPVRYSCNKSSGNDILLSGISRIKCPGNKRAVRTCFISETITMSAHVSTLQL